MTGRPAAAPAHRKRIVILGAGFAGAYGAQALERRLRGGGGGGGAAEVILLDRHNYFVFHPLLVEAGTGSLEPRHAVVPIRAFLRRTEFLMAEITAIDLAAQTVACRLIGDDDERTLRYDHLVIALGSVTRLPPVPGLREHGFELKSLTDAVALRDRAIQLLELANATENESRRRALLRFIVVGGNFTGVEVAGEFDVLLRHAARRYAHVRPGEASVTLIELSGRILSALDAGLSDYAADRLRRRGVDVRLETTVETVEPDHVMLSGGERLDAHTVIWCAGIEPPPLVRALPVPLDERGYIVCERDLRVRGFENVWAIGDCAVNTDSSGRAYPATAQHAVREGAHLARNLAAVLRGRPATPCDIVSLGSIAPLGCRTGVARVFGIRLSGFAAWFLWRTVYLLKMPTLSRKVRVALDWTIDLVFSRDDVQLGVHRPAARPAETIGAQAPPSRESVPMS
jgi:NADH dehydrogenase